MAIKASWISLSKGTTSRELTTSCGKGGNLPLTGRQPSGIASAVKRVWKNCAASTRRVVASEHHSPEDTPLILISISPPFSNEVLNSTVGISIQFSLGLFSNVSSCSIVSSFGRVSLKFNGTHHPSAISLNMTMKTTWYNVPDESFDAWSLPISSSQQTSTSSATAIKLTKQVAAKVGGIRALCAKIGYCLIES
ncbi:hypothetical protein V6N11_076210 [Hibiscus sabdariffa]|uniref:Uncharacterized protein n=1 Tax=Hibiscus sabdariffa TaxID=183260 RepID=A0ABR2Q617_9ROSI